MLKPHKVGGREGEVDTVAERRLAMLGRAFPLVRLDNPHPGDVFVRRMNDIPFAMFAKGMVTARAERVDVDRHAQASFHAVNSGEVRNALM